MPKIPPISDSEASGPVCQTFEQLRRRVGLVPNMYRTLAHAPAVLDAAAAMGQAIRNDLDPKLRELAYLKTARLTDCHYCLHYHLPLGRKAGLTESQIGDLDRFEASAAYAPLEKDVLRFTEQWATSGRVEEAVLGRLTAALSPAHLVLLAATVAQANFTTRFNVVFGLELP